MNCKRFFAMNVIFDVKYNAEKGGLSSLVICGDPYEMNWIESQSAVWGVPYHNAQIRFNAFDPLRLVRFDEGCCVFENAMIRTSVERSFSVKGNLIEKYIVKNISNTPIFVGKGEFGVYTPFNDNYEAAEYCLTNKCHTHIYCGGKAGSVCALRMGDSELNIGLALTEGRLDCYRQWVPEHAKNDRGDFMLCPAPFTLGVGEKKTVMAWEVFIHSGKEDFKRRIIDYVPQIVCEVNQETVFVGEEIKINAKCFTSAMAEVDTDAKIIDERNAQFEYDCTLLPKRLGEHNINISFGRDASADIKAYVLPPFESILRSRADFICKKQQFIKRGSPLDGAFLIYDNESNSTYFSNFVADHNASRERIGMGIFLAKYLQTHFNKNYDKALSRYEKFVFREFVDPETGDVFDTIGRDPSAIRLYNAPWVCTFACELYKYRKEDRYLGIAYRVMKKYYNGDGANFYPNAFSIAEVVRLLQDARMEDEASDLFDYAILHAERIIANGTNYPKHEVDYEQTIVAPAVTFILQAYELTGEPSYKREAKKHLDLLSRFNGFAPDYRLDEVAIRHWDDYWFGKSAMFGDTFPHYWSVLSGWCYYLWYKASGDRDYLDRAVKSARNCLCLFNADGSASCAHIYPYMVNDKKGDFYDAWANDQDFALYYAMSIFEGAKENDRSEDLSCC